MGSGTFHNIRGEKDHEMEILNQYLQTSSKKLKLGLKWVFQMDKNPNHTGKLVTNWTKDKVFRKWSLQSAELHTIKKL